MLAVAVWRFPPGDLGHKPNVYSTWFLCDCLHAGIQTSGHEVSRACSVGATQLSNANYLMPTFRKRGKCCKQALLCLFTAGILLVSLRKTYNSDEPYEVSRVIIDILMFSFQKFKLWTMRSLDLCHICPFSYLINEFC